MNTKDVSQWETTQQTEVENKYIPGSSEKKRASVMYLFFGIIASLSKKEFSPFELYHLKQSIWLWITILPIVLVCFIPVLKWISILVLIVLMTILGISFYNAWNWKYFENSKNVALSLFAGLWWRFLDLFELWIKSKDSEEDSTSEKKSDATLENLQNENTTLEEDIQKLDEAKDSQWEESK